MMRWCPLWLLPQVVWAAAFGLAWEWPRASQPKPDAFLITYSAPDGQSLAQMQTPPSVPGACVTPGQAPATDPGLTDDTFCTQWPSCPPPGVQVFWVQARWSDGTLSDRSEPQLTCLFTAEQPCVCEDATTWTPPPRPAPVVVPPLPPGEIPPIQHVTLPPLPPFTPLFPPAPT